MKFNRSIYRTFDKFRPSALATFKGSLDPVCKAFEVVYQIGGIVGHGDPPKKMEPGKFPAPVVFDLLSSLLGQSPVLLTPHTKPLSVVLHETGDALEDFSVSGFLQRCVSGISRRLADHVNRLAAIQDTVLGEAVLVADRSQPFAEIVIGRIIKRVVVLLHNDEDCAG
jgi:hypothetical protein